MKRILNVVRMQLVNRQTFVWVPLIVLGGTLALTYAIFAIVRSAGAEGPLVGFGAHAPMWYFLVVGVQSLTLTFPFSQAMSVTRRDFYLGTLFTAVGTSILLGLTFLVIGLLEDATNGFGLGGSFARVAGVWDGGPGAAFAFYVALTMLAFVSGFASAVIFKRFGLAWLVVSLLTLAAALVAVVWAVTSARAWPSVLTWVGGQGVAGMAGWIALLALLLAVVAYLPLRRLVP